MFLYFHVIFYIRVKYTIRARSERKRNSAKLKVNYFSILTCLKLLNGYDMCNNNEFQGPFQQILQSNQG